MAASMETRFPLFRCWRARNAGATIFKGSSRRVSSKGEAIGGSAGWIHERADCQEIVIRPCFKPCSRSLVGTATCAFAKACPSISFRTVSGQLSERADRLISNRGGSLWAESPWPSAAWSLAAATPAGDPAPVGRGGGGAEGSGEIGDKGAVKMGFGAKAIGASAGGGVARASEGGAVKQDVVSDFCETAGGADGGDKGARR